MLDQADGLRRRNAGNALHAIHCRFEGAGDAARLAAALAAHGCKSLLIDASGRLLADAAPRPLFDWRAQLARGELAVMPAAFGAIWHASGFQDDTPLLLEAARSYDLLLIDNAVDAQVRPTLSAVRQDHVVSVGGSDASRLAAYAVLKTFAAQHESGRIFLLGDAAAQERVHAACRRFLDDAFCQRLERVAGERDEFATLAVRMLCEETGARART